MKMLSRILSCALAVCLLLAPAAMAQGTVSMVGRLQPADAELITAPMSGSVLEWKAEAGDRLQAEDALMVIDTVHIYAPCDGTVAALRAHEGDSLSYINMFYGAAMYIEPKSEYIIQASTTNAYDANDNRMIHVGEEVYLTSVNNSSRTGEGIVTHVDGENYTVEVIESNIRLNETCRISRDDDSSYEKGRIGQGKTKRNNPVAIAAEGSVVKLHVREGDEVKMGDLLMEIAPDQFIEQSESTLCVNKDCIVMSVLVNEGGVVQKGQPIAQIFTELHAVVQISEYDLAEVEVGDSVTVMLDIDPDEYRYKGRIEKISYIPSESVLGGVMYDVTVSFENDEMVRAGMSVTVETVDR
jgi:biotin carboxyl carrier protein